MLGMAFSAAVLTIDAELILAEADVKDGLPSVSLIGALACETKEAKDRVRIALENSGYRLPVKRITVNLSPADIKKEGTAFDLSIAAAILAAYGLIPDTSLKSSLFMGELCLDGKLHPVPGVLPAVCLAKEQGFFQCFVPLENAEEAALTEGITVYGLSTLQEVVAVLQGDGRILPYQKKGRNRENDSDSVDFSEVQGQVIAKRALEIAAAGRHNVLMIGPPGTGKTMLAKRLPTILPSLTYDEKLEISKIYSVAGLLTEKGALIDRPPFQAPHHTVTQAALAGGGRRATPGIVSLAHKGVLFLDEFPEFHRDAIEILREPLEERTITVSRFDAAYVYPAGGMLVAAMNPCVCGFYPDRNRCSCTQSQIRRYIGKISRPLLERFDLCLEVLPVKYNELHGNALQESSQKIKERVERARRIQRERYKESGVSCNSDLSSSEVKRYCCLTAEAKKLMEQAYNTYELSARSYHRVLKTARTIADLKEQEQITETELSEALLFRQPDQKYWGE